MFEHIIWVDVREFEQCREHMHIEPLSEGLEFLFDSRVLTARQAGRLLKKVAPVSERTDHPLPSGTVPESVGARRRRYKSRQRKLRQQRMAYALAYRIGTLMGTRKKFADAWVFVDRNTQANDNAEALYRYVQRYRPDLNAWFAIDKSSPDFARLKSEGFRVVDYGSKRHFCLMKEAKVLASSMVDQYVLQPFPKAYLPKTWTYSFLQHGVTKDLVHRWWNWKTIDHLVTSTRDEFESIVADGSPYVLSTKEVSLSGMPRHDRLFELRRSASITRRSKKRVVIMPTWRNYLAGATVGARNEQVEGFHETTFVRNWSRLLLGPLMKDLVASSDTEVVLLPHPGIDEHWKDLALPDGMRRCSYLGDDVQKLLAESDLVITDYSSQAFEGAFCGVPSVYFQFDRDEFFAGGHIGSQGYFDYFEHGFGPVIEHVEDMERAVRSMLDGSHPDLKHYEQRIQSVYAFRDSGASKRVVAAIEQRIGAHPHT